MKHNLLEIWNKKKTAKNFVSLTLEEIQQVFDGYFHEVEPIINGPFIKEELPVDKEIVKILPAIRMILSGSNIKVSEIRNNNLIKEAGSNSQSFEKIAGPVTPGELILSGLPALYIENKEDIPNNLAKKLKEYKKQHNSDPELILVKNFGLIAASETSQKAVSLLNEFERKSLFVRYSSAVPVFLSKEERDYLEKLKKEDTISGKTMGKVSQKIIVITGGAQGFGRGIAEDLFEQHANLVIADINDTTGNNFAEQLNKQQENNRAIFVKTDVSDTKSVQNLVYETVKHFGGIDVFISNAGILRAGGLDDIDPETFNLVTNVNYNAYFYCVKYVSEVLKTQAACKPGYFTDIIQINSKSGLKGSNKNFSYAGGKFGGIGLTQSFALELMPHCIKVNAVCPGNFFDGPLWSDPNNGLFVQYLNAGKVPGARTIDDVKKFYEAQVPAKRGCTVSDIMKAIYYVIDQEYETGQAVPVTGGQNMIN